MSASTSDTFALMSEELPNRKLPHLIGFALIWGALVVYSLEGVHNNRKARLVAVAT